MYSALNLKPKMTEKAYDLSKEKNSYTFMVPKNSSKHIIKKAVQEQFKVEVTNVRVLNKKGKSARSIRMGGIRKNVYGKRPGQKIAYVTILEGQKIPVFAAVEEAEKKEKARAKKAKKKESK